MMKKIAVLLVCAMCVSPLFCEVAQVQKFSEFKQGETFFLDLSGYHSLGSGTGATKEEALRQAKAQALKNLFREIGKDQLFQEMFISAWPETIKLSDSSVSETKDAAFSAQVHITIPQNPVILMEANYRSAAISLLDKAESSLEQAATTADEAAVAEGNLHLSEALTLFKQAQSKTDEAILLVRPIADMSVLSARGLNKTAIMQTAATLHGTVSSGMDRIAAAEQKVLRETGMAETRNTYELLTAELEDIGTIVETYASRSPFYDLQKYELEHIVASLENGASKNKIVLEKLHALLKTVPGNQSFLREKIQFSITDSKEYGAALAAMTVEAKEEIRYPRLAKQEDAYRNARFWEAVGKGVEWFFLHEPKDVFTIRYHLPFFIDPSKGGGWSEEFNMSARMEGLFPVGFWIRSDFVKNDTVVSDRITDIALTQEIDLGFFSPYLIGAGFGWDWIHGITTDSVYHPLSSRMFAKVFFGIVNPRALKPLVIISFSYMIPQFAEPFVLPYHINADVDILFRAADFLFLEAGASSGTYQNAPHGPSLDAVDALTYLLQFYGGIAFRLPLPFSWGVRYSTYLKASLDRNGNLGKLENLRNGITFFVEYSL